MNREHLQFAREKLVALSTYYSDNMRTWGICYQLVRHFLNNSVTVHNGVSETLHNWLEEKFVDWEHYSGNLDYPVPSGDPIITPYDAFQGVLWDDDAYGNKRRALCVYLIECIDKDLGEPLDS